MLKLIFIVFYLVSAVAYPSDESALDFATRSPGVEVATLEDGDMTVIRVDPKVASIVLLNPPKTKLSVAQVAKANKLQVAINAAMFSTDYKTSIGFMRSHKVVNNSRHVANLKGYLMIDPKKSDEVGAMIGNRSQAMRYNMSFQSHRMWTREGGILWKAGRTYHNIGLAGVDERHRVIFFFHRDLIDVHELVAKILKLKLKLDGLIYLDGGTHAVLYLASSLGTSVNVEMTVPNLIGIKAKP